MKKLELPEECTAKLATMSPQDCIICINALSPVLTALRHADRCYRNGPGSPQPHAYIIRCANMSGQIEVMAAVVQGFKDALDESSHQLELWERDKGNVV